MQRPSWSGFQFPLELPFESVGGRLNQIGESAMLLDVGLTVIPGLTFPAEFPLESVASSAALSVTVEVTGKTETDSVLVEAGIQKSGLSGVYAEIGIARSQQVPMLVGVGLSVVPGLTFPAEFPVEFADSPCPMSIRVDVLGRSQQVPMLMNIGVHRVELVPLSVYIQVLVLKGGYQVQLLNATGNLVALLDPIFPEYRRRQNQATSFSFGVLADDTRIQELQAARHCTLYRDGVEKAAGYITARDFTSNPYRIECMTNEALLRRNLAPRAWKKWNNWDLADAVKDLTLGFKTQTRNTGDDWLAAVDKNNVDVLTWPGRVFLAKDAAGAYVPHGYITVQLDMGTVNRYDLLRWSEDVGEATRIRAQFRTSPDAVNWSSWSVELASVYPDEDGVALTGDGRYIQIRFHLYTDDTTTLDKNEVPTGFTPQLLGAEVIARTPGPVTVGNVPVSTGSIVQGYTFDRENALRILQTWCEDYGYEFYVDGDKRLHFARQLGQTKNVILRRTSTMNVQRLSDNADEIQNVVTCLGAGSGSAQLQVVLRDEESIQAYGELPGVFQDTSCETIEALTTAGQKYLAANAWPKEEFMVTSVPVWELEDFQLYDTVTVVDPLRGVVTSARVLDEERRLEKTGENVTLGLNTTLDNIIERIVKGQIPKIPQEVDPFSPSEVWARGIVKGIRVGLNMPHGDWAYTEVHMSTASGFVPSSGTRKDAGKQLQFDILGLEPGLRYYVRVINVDNNGNKSEPSVEVSAVPITQQEENLRDYTDGVDDYVEGLSPVLLVSQLPELPDKRYPNGTIVFLITDQKLYRNDGGNWVLLISMHLEDLDGELQGNQIALNAITEELIAAAAITETKIADDSISTAKLLANAVTAAKIAAEAVTAAKIAAGAITTDKLAANVVTAEKLAAGAVTANEIMAGILQAGGITADYMAANTLHVFDKVPGTAAGGKVKINSGGVSITDGRLTVKNPAGTTIIDGTSRMFRIHQTGTVNIPAGGYRSISFPSLGYRPACLAYMLGTNDQLAGRSVFPYYIYYERSGAYSWGIWVHTSTSDIRIDNHFSWALDVRYYVLKEEAI